MESSSVTNLIELLKSQLALFSELRNLLESERIAVVAWHPEETIALTKKKETIMHREHILEEARKTLVARIIKEFSISEPTLSAIIAAIPSAEQKTALKELREQLALKSDEIQAVSAALKMLYSTNLKIVNDIYEKMGYIPADKYGMGGKRSAGAGSASISALG